MMEEKEEVIMLVEKEVLGTSLVGELRSPVEEVIVVEVTGQEEEKKVAELVRRR